MKAIELDLYQNILFMIMNQKLEPEVSKQLILNDRASSKPPF